VTDQKRVAEFLGELVGTAFPTMGKLGPALRAARQDAQLMSEQMRQAWMDFLGAETAVHPVMLVLETCTGRLRHGAVHRHGAADRRDRPWMCSRRAARGVRRVSQAVVGATKVQEIRLKELGRKAGERLVRQVLGDRVGPGDDRAPVKQADGNAFYLEELIRAVRRARTRCCRRPCWR